MFVNNISEDKHKPYTQQMLQKLKVMLVVGSVYCTSATGLIGSCNCVAGLLFRVEAAVLTGVAHWTCTSKLWNVPNGKKQIRLGEITSFLFVQDTCPEAAV